MLKNFTVEMDDGVHIHVNHWLDDKESKEILIILHGMAEHSLRYAEFAEFLVNHNYEVYAWDHRGHGQTGEAVNELGYFYDTNGWQRVVDDIKSITKWINKEHQGKDIIIMGHSMGSLLARTALQQYGEEYKGAIISGTTLGGSIAKQKIGRLFTQHYIKKHGTKKQADLLDKMTFGNFNNQFKPTKTSFDWLSRDEKQVNLYEEDSLCGFICSSSFFLDLIDGTGITRDKKEIEKIPKDIPIYLYAGDQDPVSQGGKEVKKLYKLYKDIGIKDVELKLYEDGRHEMLNETNRYEVYEDILRWLEKHQ
ncbi:alpha/beta hydrolase [Vallitalea okinawensis]|uniref:alpha/beta hydrolase n=1 Tax=Vallitalea okinawensis TaxID=2078660 RepID=UPI000CFADB22|nr:alpha/beta hydrolase [Vallitalea okinawensis]